VQIPVEKGAPYLFCKLRLQAWQRDVFTVVAFTLLRFIDAEGKDDHIGRACDCKGR
jgi:hypothetical protein